MRQLCYVEAKEGVVCSMLREGEGKGEGSGLVIKALATQASKFESPEAP